MRLVQIDDCAEYYRVARARHYERVNSEIRAQRARLSSIRQRVLIKDRCSCGRHYAVRLEYNDGPPEVLCPIVYWIRSHKCGIKLTPDIFSKMVKQYQEEQ